MQFLLNGCVEMFAYGLYKKRRAIDKHYRFGLCLADFVKTHNFGVNTKALCFLYLVGSSFKDSILKFPNRFSFKKFL